MVWGIAIWTSGSIQGKRKSAAEVVPLSCGFDGTLRQSRLQNFVTFVGMFHWQVYPATVSFVGTSTGHSSKQLDVL